MTILQVLRKTHKGQVKVLFSSSWENENTHLKETKRCWTSRCLKKIESYPEKNTKQREIWHMLSIFLQGKISLPKHLYLLLLRIVVALTQLKVKVGFGTGAWLSPSLNPIMVLKEKLRVSVSYQKSLLLWDRIKHKSRDYCYQNSVITPKFYFSPYLISSLWHLSSDIYLIKI